MEPVGNVLFGLYRGTPQHEEWIIACLEGAWPSLLGERLAKICRPHQYKQGCLTIEITNPAWTDALCAMEADLLEKLRGATRHEVRQLRFREPGGVPANPPL